MAENPQPANRAPLTPEELEARYEMLSKKAALSRIFAEHRDPNYVVRWVRNDKFDLSTHTVIGFEVCNDNPKVHESKRNINTVIPISDDGKYRTGDVILMQIPRVDYEFYLRKNAEESKRLVGAGKDGFKKEAAKLGVEVFERDKQGRPVSVQQ